MKRAAASDTLIRKGGSAAPYFFLASGFAGGVQMSF
jgi:hypothetical protein